MNAQTPADESHAALSGVGVPTIVKKAAFGCDGKAEPRADRTMDYLTVQADTLDESVARVTQAYDALQMREWSVGEAPRGRQRSGRQVPPP